MSKVRAIRRKDDVNVNGIVVGSKQCVVFRCVAPLYVFMPLPCLLPNIKQAPSAWYVVICSVGGDLSDVRFNPKYAGHIYKITVAADNLGNTVWICDLMPGTSADVMIWDQRAPLRTHGQFFDFEIGAHDGVYKGIMMPMASIVQGWSTSLHGCGNGGLSAMSRHALQRSCMAMCVFCSTLLSIAFADKLGINPMDLGLRCLSLYGHRRRQPLRRRKMMTVFVANCVATVLVIYPSVALAT